jgi:hypothetical protein
VYRLILFKIKYSVLKFSMVNSLSSGLSDFDGELQKLTSRVRHYPKYSAEEQQALEKLVDTICYSHKLSRQSRLLLPVVQQISLKLKQQLLHDVREEIDSYNPKHTSVRKWVNYLRSRALKKVLDDAMINQIAQEAKQATPNSNERRLILNLLVEAIQMADKFSHPQRSSFLLSPDIYEYIYKETIQITLMEICLNIDRYNPSSDMMAWVNFLVSRRFSDTYNKYRKQGITKAPKFNRNLKDNSQSEIKIVFLDSPDTLEKLWHQDEATSKSQKLRYFIEEDPGETFVKAHITNRPDVNFKVILLEKVWGDKTWESLADKWQIDSIQTLSSFFNRCLKKFRPVFLEYLQD